MKSSIPSEPPGLTDARTGTGGQRVLHARHLLDAEVASAVRGLLLGGKLSQGAPLLTLDAKFSGATGHRATVHGYPYGDG